MGNNCHIIPPPLIHLKHVQVLIMSTWNYAGGQDERGVRDEINADSWKCQVLPTSKREKPVEGRPSGGGLDPQSNCHGGGISPHSMTTHLILQQRDREAQLIIRATRGQACTTQIEMLEMQRPWESWEIPFHFLPLLCGPEYSFEFPAVFPNT